MANNFTLSFRVVDRASNSFRRIARSTQELERSGKGMAATWGDTAQVLLATAGAITAGFTAAAAAAAEVEDSLARLETVTRGTAGQITVALDNAKQSAIDFSTQYTASAAELIHAQFQIATAGVAVEEQVHATQGAFQLAIATQGSFAQSTQLLGSLLNTFGKAAEFNYLDPARKIEAITDKLSLAVQRFQVTLPVLAESLKFVIGPASTLGLKFTETTAALGVLNTAGFRGSLAGTALSNMFNKLDRAVTMLNLDPSKFVDLNGNLKDMASFLEEVSRGLEGMTSIEQQNKLIEVFDIRAGRVVKTLLNQVGAIRKNTIEMELNVGATKRMADIQQTTLSASSKKAANAFTNLAVSVGEKLAPSLKAVMAVLTGFGVALRWVIEAMGPFSTVFVVAIAGLSGLTAIIVIAAVAVKAFAVLQIGVAIKATWAWVMAIIAGNAALAKMAVLMYAAFVVTVQVTFAAYGFAAACGVVLVELIILTGGIYAVVAAIGWLVSLFYDASDGSEALKQSMETDFNSISRSASRASSEMDKIAKLGKTDVKLVVGVDLGDSPLANMLEELSTGRSVASVGKLEAAMRKLAETRGVTLQAATAAKQLTDKLQGGAQGAQKFASAADKMMTATNLTYKDMSFAEKAFELTRLQLRGMELQMMKNADGNQELAASFKKINDAISVEDYESIAEIFRDPDFLAGVDQNSAVTKFAQNISKAASSPQAKLAISQGGHILAQHLKMELENAAEKTDVKLALDLGNVEGIGNVQTQIQNALSNTRGAFEQAADGAISFGEAVERSGKSAAVIEQLLASMEGQDFADLAKSFKNINWMDPKGIDEWVDHLENSLAEMKTAQLAVKMMIETDKWKADIDKRIANVQTGPLGQKFRTMAFELGEDLQDAAADFLTGGDAVDFADALRDAIRKKVTENAALQLSTSLMTGMAPAIDKLKDQIEKAVNVNTLLGDVAGLPNVVKDLINNSDIGKAMGGIFKSVAKEFVEDLTDSIKDSQISLDVLLSRGDLDATTASFAARMRDILNTSNLDSAEGMANAIRRTRALLKQSTNQQADTGVTSIIEGHLEELLTAREELSKTAMDPIGDITTKMMDGMPGIWAQGNEVAANLGAAGKIIGDALAKAMNLPFGDWFKGGVSGADVGRNVGIEIGGNTLNIDIEAAASGSNLTEADVERIMRSVAEALAENNADQIREVREQLDELKRR